MDDEDWNRIKKLAQELREFCLARGFRPAEIQEIKPVFKRELETARILAVDKEARERREARKVSLPVHRRPRRHRRDIFGDGSNVESRALNTEDRRARLIEEKLRDLVAFASPAQMQEWCEDEGIGCAYPLVMVVLRKLISRGAVVRKIVTDPETGERLGPRYFHVDAKKKARV